MAAYAVVLDSIRLRRQADLVRLGYVAGRGQKGGGEEGRKGGARGVGQVFFFVCISLTTDRLEEGGRFYPVAICLRSPVSHLAV